MDNVQEGTEERGQESLKGSDIHRIALTLESRGVVITDKTLGEILFLEEQAHYRDRVNWACSAQNDKLLPPQKRTGPPRKKHKPTEAIVGSMFSAYEKGEP